MEAKIVELLTKLKTNSILFNDVISFIEQHYEHRPTAFTNGAHSNEATQNQGSAKVFSFAKLNHLEKEDTLQLFAEHYQSVCNKPDGSDHQNIRQFMLHGWDGIQFEGEALRPR